MNLLSSLVFPSYFQGTELWKVFFDVLFFLQFDSNSLHFVISMILDVSSSTEQDSGFILPRAFENPNLCFAGFFCWSNHTGPDEATFAKSSSGRRTRHVGREVRGFTDLNPNLEPAMSIFEPFPVFSNFEARLELQAKDAHWKVQSSELKINKEMLGEVNGSLSGIPRKSGK